MKISLMKPDIVEGTG